MKECGRFKFISIGVAILFVLTVNSQVLAQSNEWAIKMFSEMGGPRLHDFGSVALHANVEHRFQFKNVYDSDVVISSVSSNCGCTKASASKSLIRPGEVAEIIARVDTSGREHTKARKATIRVLFSKPAVAEVQLQVKTYIRPDVGFEPGQIDLGTVPFGGTVVKKAFLQYEGRPDWALIGIQKNNPGIKAEAREVRRQGGSVLYEIQVELKPDATPGYIDDLLRFKTNDRDLSTSSIFLPIEGLVVEPLSVKPGCLQLGVVPQKGSVSKNLVVSGTEPFKVVDVSSDDGRLRFIKTDLTRSVHVIPVTFRAGSRAGNFSSSITIKTSHAGDGGDEIQETTIETLGVVVEEGDSNLGIPQATENDEEETDESSPQSSAKGVDALIDDEDDSPKTIENLEFSEKAKDKTLKSEKNKEIVETDRDCQETRIVKNEPGSALEANSWTHSVGWRAASSESERKPSSNVMRVASFSDIKRF